MRAERGPIRDVSLPRPSRLADILHALRAGAVVSFVISAGVGFWMLRHGISPPELIESTSVFWRLAGFVGSQDLALIIVVAMIWLAMSLVLGAAIALTIYRSDMRIERRFAALRRMQSGETQDD